VVSQYPHQATLINTTALAASVTPSIRFVYFDLGNVLATFDVDRACRNVSDRWGVDHAAVRLAIWDSGLQDRFEHGEISAEQFADLIRRALFLDRDSAPTEELLDRLSDMFAPVEEMISLVDEVRHGGVRLGILSNTCVAHWQWLIRAQYAALRGHFDQVILSFEHGVMKPHASLYQIATDRSGELAHSILFFDDRPDNIAAAQASGWHAHQFTDAAAAREVLRGTGVLS